MNEKDILYHFRNIIKKMHKAADRELVTLGMNHREMRMLLSVYKNDGCSQDRLASLFPIDRSNVGRGLKKLEELGFISRSKDDADGRGRRVFITDKGFEIRDEIYGIKARIEKRLLSGVGDGELQIFLEILKKMDEAFII